MDFKGNAYDDEDEDIDGPGSGGATSLFAENNASRSYTMRCEGRFYPCPRCSTPRWVEDRAPAERRLACWMSPCVAGGLGGPIQCKCQRVPSGWRVGTEIPPERADARAQAVHDTIVAR
eukprot:13390571-Alexandrium_andersonii.AAC.1